MFPSPTNVSRIRADELPHHDATVIDVRTPGDFKAQHIPGSLNFCVYEVSFLEKVPEKFPDKSTPMVVYGHGEPYRADLAALHRLHSLGYSNVSVLEGGLTAWISRGNAVDGEGVTAPVSPRGHYSMDTARSRIRWIGRNLTNQHDGEVKALEGFMDLDDSGRPVAGRVTVDLNQLSCRDIADAPLAGVLIRHLQHEDFFAVSQYPEASFEIQSAHPISGATVGQPNYQVTGTLSARGRQLSTELDALVAPVECGMVFQSVFNFDRTDLGACYGSGKFFERLGMHLVSDLVTVDVSGIFVPDRA